MADTAFTRNEIIGLVLRLSLVSAVTYYSIKWIMSHVDPTNKTKRKAKERAEEQLKRYAIFFQFERFFYHFFVMSRIG